HSVSWVPRKQVDHALVATLLSRSEESGQFTNYGPAVRALEKYLGTILEIHQSKTVICTSSGTAALHAIGAALNMRRDSSASSASSGSSAMRIATQGFTFPSSGQMKSTTEVIVIDVDKGGGLDLDILTERLTEGRIDVIVVTNVFGNIVDIGKYETFCDRHGIHLIFDNAATPFTFYNGSNSCNCGTASAVSLHHTKLIGFGEGGVAIVDKDLEPYVRRAINFGIDNNADAPKWHPMGSNWKMSDVSAAYIMQFLVNGFPRIANHSLQLYEHLKVRLVEEGVDVRTYPNFSDAAPVLSCFALLFPFNTQGLVEHLMANSIYCRRYYDPLDASLPVSSEIRDTILCLPCHIDVSISDVDRYVSLICEW
ncbi:unnamed protein product, partial [Phaeothamnion confervicola]